MDRRGFLGAGAATAASAFAGGACAPSMRLSHRPEPSMPRDMDAYVARIDAGMDYLATWSSAKVVPGAAGDLSQADALGRAALQSLFITGMVSDLPLEGQMNPAIQKRLDRAMPLMDQAIDGMSTFLRSRSPAELAIVQTALRDHDAGSRILSLTETEAARLGMSDWRREHTRSLLANAEWRLRTQPADILISEYVGKVERLGASDVRAEAAIQTIAANVAEAAFWQEAEDKRSRRIGRGAKVMGYGALTFAAGGVIVAAGGFAAVFIMTVGVIMILVGLIILLVGLATPSAKIGAGASGAGSSS